MKKIICFILALAFIVFPVSVYAHPGRTDGKGGHYDYFTGEYHYHHGYSAHSHYDIDGDGDIDCPLTYKNNITVASSDTDNKVVQSLSTATDNKSIRTIIEDYSARLDKIMKDRKAAEEEEEKKEKEKAKKQFEENQRLQQNAITHTPATVVTAPTSGSKSSTDINTQSKTDSAIEALFSGIVVAGLVGAFFGAFQWLKSKMFGEEKPKKTKSTKENPPVIAEVKTDKVQENTKPEAKVQYDKSVNENIDKIDNYFNKE